MNQIKYYRFIKSWSQSMLAKVSGVSRVSISRIESGKQQPNAETKKRIAEALGIPPRKINEGD